jgi:hypothetical protein
MINAMAVKMSKFAKGNRRYRLNEGVKSYGSAVCSESWKGRNALKHSLNASNDSPIVARIIIVFVNLFIALTFELR